MHLQDQQSSLTGGPCGAAALPCSGTGGSTMLLLSAWYRDVVTSVADSAASTLLAAAVGVDTMSVIVASCCVSLALGACGSRTELRVRPRSELVVLRMLVVPSKLESVATSCVLDATLPASSQASREAESGLCGPLPLRCVARC